jgi:hypothetical protein
VAFMASSAASSGFSTTSVTPDSRERVASAMLTPSDSNQSVLSSRSPSASLGTLQGAPPRSGKGNPTLSKERTEMNSCPMHHPVAVRDYKRFRYGKWEHVRSHCRGLPRR